MALEKLPYKKLSTLIGRHLSIKGSPQTEELISELSIVKARGHLKKSELIKICRWKSPRAINLIKQNSPQKIKSNTAKVFKTGNEQIKLNLLLDLYGVSVPMASAILMLTNPKRYGVIDIRVWQLLYAMNSVKNNSTGRGFDFDQWHHFLLIIRQYAKMFNVRARDIEWALFNAHLHYQKGNLYKK